MLRQEVVEEAVKQGGFGVKLASLKIPLVIQLQCGKVNVGLFFKIFEGQPLFYTHAACCGVEIDYAACEQTLDMTTADHLGGGQKVELRRCYECD